MEDTENRTMPSEWRRDLSSHNCLEYLDILFDHLLRIETQPSLAAIAVCVDIWLELIALATDLSTREQARIKFELAVYLPPEWTSWVEFTLDDTALAQPGLKTFVRLKTSIH